MFKRIYVEISNLCNVQCSFCPIVDRDKKVMSVVEFSNIIEKLKGKADEICLHLMGEPTAHPEFEEILKICNDSGVLINLTTNGLLIKRKAELLYKSKCIRQVNFSLQSYKDNFPQKDLSQYLKPIMDFSTKLAEVRPEVYVNYRVWNVGTSSDNEEIFKLVEKNFDICINRNINVENIKSKRIWNKLYLHFDSRFEWPSLEGEILSEEGRCHGLKSHIGIQADGTVVPCCLDKEAVISLGNLHESNLDEVLSTKLAQDMKKGFEQNKIVHEMCKRCDYIQRFRKK